MLCLAVCRLNEKSNTAAFLLLFLDGKVTRFMQKGFFSLTVNKTRRRDPMNSSDTFLMSVFGLRQIKTVNEKEKSGSHCRENVT